MNTTLLEKIFLYKNFAKSIFGDFLMNEMFHKNLDLNKIRQFIDGLDLDKNIKKKLAKLDPKDYIGLASKLTEDYLKNNK